MDDRVTRFYDEMYAQGRPGKVPSGTLGALFLRLRRFELHRIPAALSLLEPGNRLLDLGCGDGTLLALARRSGFCAVYGLDVAPAVISRAKETCQRILGSLDGVDVRQQDLNQTLPFPDSALDAVTAVAVVEHIFDPYFTVAEVRRVLSDDGQFIVEVPNLAWLPRRLDVLLGRLPVTGEEEGWDGGHLHYFTFSTMRELLISGGFDIEYIGSTGIFPRVRNLWPSLLGGNILIKARKRSDGTQD